ncbi:receptor-type adenylate cyclase, putative, partial [Trypanosoma cruzi marinkellei]
MLVDSPPAAKIISELLKGFNGGRMVHNAFLITSADVSMQLISSTRNDALDALRETMEAKRVDFVGGMVTDAMLDVEGVTFIDPLPLEPRLNRFRRNVICLSPTLEQQFFCACGVPREHERRLRARSDPQRGGCSDGGCAAAVAVD